jgi:hypothetical protein
MSADVEDMISKICSIVKGGRAIRRHSESPVRNDRSALSGRVDQGLGPAVWRRTHSDGMEDTP